MPSRICCLAALGALLLPIRVPAADIQAAVAANFTAPMQEIAAAFKQETGNTVVLSFGSTGKFYAQIRNGAPFDVLLGADDTTPPLLEKEGRAVPGTRFSYAVGKLVLWSARPELVDAKGAVLAGSRFARLAIANPATAPYGIAALQTLKRLGLDQVLQGRLVQGDSITQAFQFVSTGNADLGFVALSQVWLDGRFTGGGSAWIVDPALYEPLKQDAVLLTRGKDNPAARALLDYLKTPAARKVIARYGYGI